MTADTRHSSTRNTRISHYSIVSCLGRGRVVHLDAMRAGRSGLSPCTYPNLPFDCYAGSVAALEELHFPECFEGQDNRANRLALAALEADKFLDNVLASRERWGAARCGVVVGTSTSGIEKLETAYLARKEDHLLPRNDLIPPHENHHAVAAFVQEYLGLSGPSYTISTACSSSAKAMIDAIQLIEVGACDAVIVAGIDSLCLTTLNGFEALQLVSREPCRPCDALRKGLSLGEGAAFLIMERDADKGVRLIGMGESSDGVSMSTPPADGAGAIKAMREALEVAEISPEEIDYVNLHGTGTPANDTAECAAVTKVFGTKTPASSMKGMLGHTLGAAGAVEAVMCIIAMEEGLIPGNVGLDSLDPEIYCNVVASSRAEKLSHILTNAFGFGGSNCALILSK